MASIIFRSRLITSGLAASVFLLASGASFAQQVNLTAAQTSVTLPDGSPLVGRATGIDPTGCLLVRADDGEHVLSSGDVMHVRTQ